MSILPSKLKFWNIVLLTLMLVLLNNCSSFDLIPSDSLIQRLKGRGPVLVSQDNPYLAANLLLKQESQNSKELDGFLATKGMPSALTVSQNFFEPARLKLFYKLESEQYDLELLQGIWVIKGPQTIDDNKAKELLAGTALEQKLPLGSQESTDKQLKQNSSLNKKTKKADGGEPHDFVPLFEKNGNDDNSKAAIVSQAVPQAKTEKHDTAAAITTNSLDDLIVSFPSSPAEITPKGDIVHYVTTEYETLEILAKWYTKSSLTVRQIARANKLAPSAILRPGDQVIIPVELAKNKLSLPEAAITALAP